MVSGFQGSGTMLVSRRRQGVRDASLKFNWCFMPVMFSSKSVMVAGLKQVSWFKLRLWGFGGWRLLTSYGVAFMVRGSAFRVRVVRLQSSVLGLQ